ncbi:S8 family peptidase [Citricoccus nitrophenolicus]|uniref:S8 family peptidase n=1 Tax=Citricoccus nitrophenolicus TaxID=863575 RepID=A0ABV0IG75_9MICC
MAERDRPHILVPRPPVSESFTSSGSGGSSDDGPFKGDRGGHGRRLKRELEEALVPEVNDPDEHLGTYIVFRSFPGLELVLKSLDPQGGGEQPELVAVSEELTSTGTIQLATVYIPDGKKGYFFDRLDKYVATANLDKAKNGPLIEGIQSIQRATIRELWTDRRSLFPSEDGRRSWWEVWLRKRDGEGLTRFISYAEEHGYSTSPHYLGFGDRTIILLHASTDELAQMFNSMDDIAELRRPHDVASVLTQMPAIEQSAWADDLLARLNPADADSPVVCVVDTGVQEGHPLLVDSISKDDVHVADALWPRRPVYGHGTEMAGLALFGDLQEVLTVGTDVHLLHRLESVKFLPDSGTNERDLYGAITARSVDRPEIQAPDRPRVFMLAVTVPQPQRDDSDTPAENVEDGKPTSWSATIDALSYGRGIDDTDFRFTYLDRDQLAKPRLFVVSAGNIRDIQPADGPLDRSDTEPVEDPAQAWNVLTVGAYTDKDDMSGALPIFDGYVPLAQRGQLSPASRTSVTFDRQKWPFKPDVVAEGGNVAASPSRTGVDTPESLAVLTTRLQQPGQGVFTTTRDTSAATAQVAAIAADVMATYPELRPETVRALVVHSAEWTPAMLAEIDLAPNRTEKVSRLRRYGMGVPSVDRALRSATDALTLISEAQIHPFDRVGSSNSGRACEMNLHALPWPKTELQALGDINVKMRVTLSYFIEPNPSSRGWTGRYAYPSHGLRFAVRRPAEGVDDFRKRINKKARVEGETRLKLSGDSEKRWLFGTNQQQSAGSLHTDIWVGPAAELANKEAVAVYPVAGWWKDRSAYDQSKSGVHYSLVVGIESPTVEVDFWTPVAQQVAPEIVIET